MVQVGIRSCNSGREIYTTTLPSVFLSPIRIDILKFVNLNMAKNKRQAYSVNQSSGMNTSAISWGTGRAVARVPRVKGSGTNRNGQGAIANSCRGGRMFSPTTVWRKWHHKIIKNQRLYAITSSIACSGIVSLVLARGHDLKKTPEIPLVVESCVESFYSTKCGQKSLKHIGAYNDIIKKKKKNLRSGKGKLRNRRYKKCIGPLIIFKYNARCFRNIASVETCCVDFLNLQQLAPGGHVGRFCIWTSRSFSWLDIIYKNVKKNTIQNIKNVINSNLD